VSVVPGVLRVRWHLDPGATEIAITSFPARDHESRRCSWVRARVNQVQSALPPNLTIEVETAHALLVPIVSYNVEAESRRRCTISRATRIKPLISRVPGVGRVDVQGSDVRELEVIADPARLASQRMTYADLADAIRRAIHRAGCGTGSRRTTGNT